MKKSLQWLRGVREMMGVEALSEMGEHAYFDALAMMTDEEVLAALRAWMRKFDHVPTPGEVRCLAAELRLPAAPAAEVSHG